MRLSGDKRRLFRRADWAGSMGFVLGLLVASSSIASEPDLDALLNSLSFSSSAKQQILDGEFVVQNLPSASSRELAVGLAFKVEAKPEVIAAALLEGIAIAEDTRALRFGAVSLPTDTEDLANVKLQPGEIERWRSATPGEDINLSAAEFTHLKEVLAPTDGKEPDAAEVQQAVKQVLLERMRSYQMSGLNGIRPYLRDDDEKRDGGKELRIASRASMKVGVFDSGFYDLLLAYPNRKPPGFREAYFWVVEKGPSSALVSLTHRFVVPQDYGFGTVQRQFYVTNGYNVEQALARVVPVDGGSVVLYTNRTSTDEVSGFGGGARRAIGDDLMRAQLKSLYQRMTRKLESAVKP